MLSITGRQIMFRQQALSQRMAFLHPAQFRRFSSYSQVQGQSILISNQHPPKIKLPLNESLIYDVSLHKDETIGAFEEKVKSLPKVASLSILDSHGKAYAKEAPLSEPMKGKFHILLNHKKFEVYP